MAAKLNSLAKRTDDVNRRAVRVGDDLIVSLLKYDLCARSLRCQMFDREVINDSSWLLVQDLFAGFLRGAKMRTKELSAASGLPQTTVLRYLNHLERLNFVRRESDPDDCRVTLVSMTDWGAYLLREYYSQIIASEKLSGHGREQPTSLAADRR